MSLVERIDRIKDATAFAQWIKLNTRNKAINRKAKCRPTTNCYGNPQVPLEYAGRDCSFLDSFAAPEAAEEIDTETTDRKMVDDVLGGVGEMDREILSARYLEGKRFQQIADVTGLPLGTVKRRASVARVRAAEFAN